MQSRSTGSLQRSRDDKSDETNFSDLRREILGTFGGSDEHGTKGGFGGFAASCEAKSPIRPDHSHWLPGAYSQKLGGKFAQRFCDATLKASDFVNLYQSAQNPNAKGLMFSAGIDGS